MPAMKPLCAGLLVLLLAVPVQAEEPSLQTARLRWLKGNYEEALDQYTKLAKDPKHRVAATLGQSRALQSQGKYDQALKAIDAALADHPKSADLHARRAELLHFRGRWADAEKAAEQALAINPNHFLARWVRAQVYRDRGDLKKADVEFRWFVRTFTTRSEKDDDIKDPDELLLVGLAGTEYARWHSLSDQFRVILNDVYGDALKNDKAFWPAEYQSGMLLLEKYNLADALDAFDKALKINPSAAEAWVAKGIAALQKFEIKDAESHAARALECNPHLPEALRLKGDVLLALSDVPGALRELEKARAINPRDEHTLGRMAACFALQKQNAELTALIAEVEKHNPKAAVFYFDLAERLEERRHYDAAEKYFKKSAELQPLVPWAQNSLGLLYMRMGREAEARKILERAFEADEFNVRVSNTLKVLRHLDRYYETRKTKYFELRFDPKNDQVLARYMGEYLDQVYEELAELFQYRPAVPILVELFNKHEMFSGRVVALPDLHTIGACTGRMVAMVSPRDQSKIITKPFNWGRVVRHELVHIFNLEQTNFLVPHWFTEGLAVINEGYPRPEIWNQLLKERVPAGELMNLDDIHLGFIRPRTPLDWQMAYCQSQLYVEYLKSKYGPQTVGEMLRAYRDGLDTDAAIAKVCKVDKAAFEKGYRAYLDTVVKELKGAPVRKVRTFAELREANAKNPNDAEVAALLAEHYLRRRQVKDARLLVDAVLAKKPTHPLASYVKARLELAGGNQEAALKLLQAAVDPQAPEPKVLLELGKLYYEDNSFAKAAETFELGRKNDPHNSQWLEQLLRVYTQANDKDRQIQVLKDLIPTNPDDLDQRKRLAKLLSDAGRHAEAERIARQALEIDILDKDAQELLLKALTAQKKETERKKLENLLGR
jgi:tetratricopeptide (TPR) repeat protein